MAARAISGDHVLFDECISALRLGPVNQNIYIPGDSTSFIVTSFELTQAWDLGICTVEPSVKIEFAGSYASFVSIVKNPKWIGIDNPFLFGIALSAIVSFVTMRACNAPRKDIKMHSNAYEEAALVNLTLTAGPGCTNPRWSIDKQHSARDEVKNLIDLLNKIGYGKYESVMQSIRLVHLSIINKREDFGLCYLLVVSAIESIAQDAIARDEVKETNPAEKLWKEKAKTDSDFAELLKVYKEARGGNQYLKKRYIEFILRYAPVASWEEYVPHPHQNLYDSVLASSGRKRPFLIKKETFEKYPSDLTDSEIENILSNTYTNRSVFVHKGGQPKNIKPNHEYRFFQEYNKINFQQKRISNILLANYELLLGISKYSILNWLNSIP